MNITVKTKNILEEETSVSKTIKKTKKNLIGLLFDSEWTYDAATNGNEYPT